MEIACAVKYYALQATARRAPPGEGTQIEGAARRGSVGACAKEELPAPSDPAAFDPAEVRSLSDTDLRARPRSGTPLANFLNWLNAGVAKSVAPGGVPGAGESMARQRQGQVHRRSSAAHGKKKPMAKAERAVLRAARTAAAVPVQCARRAPGSWAAGSRCAYEKSARPRGRGRLPCRSARGHAAPLQGLAAAGREQHPAPAWPDAAGDVRAAPQAALQPLQCPVVCTPPRRSFTQRVAHLRRARQRSVALAVAANAAAHPRRRGRALPVLQWRAGASDAETGAGANWLPTSPPEELLAPGNCIPLALAHLTGHWLGAVAFAQQHPIPAGAASPARQYAGVAAALRVRLRHAERWAPCLPGKVYLRCDQPLRQVSAGSFAWRGRQHVGQGHHMLWGD